MSLKIGDAGYRIIEPIASGGMGDVYKAEHIITKRIEAIKILAGSGTEEETDRFLREIQLQASLSHPNIAAVYNAFRVGDDLVMVMELVDGEPLREMLARGRLTLPLALNYAGQVLDAMAYAHAHGVIHRDITPANIIVTPLGKLKLTDFGLAKTLASPSASQAGTAMGSPHYMSPEQVRDATLATARSDIYSLGAVLYEMVSGRKVFDGDSSFLVMQAQVERVPEPPIRLEPGIPPALNAAILTALEKDPQRRFPTAHAFHKAIEQCLKNMAPPLPQLRARRNWIASAFLFTAAASAVILPVAFVAGGNHTRLSPKIEWPPIRLPALPAPPVVELPKPVAEHAPSPPPPATRPVIHRARPAKVPKSDPTTLIQETDPAPAGTGGTPPEPPVAAESAPPPATKASEPPPVHAQPALPPAIADTPPEPDTPQPAADASATGAKEKSLADSSAARWGKSFRRCGKRSALPAVIQRYHAVCNRIEGSADLYRLGEPPSGGRRGATYSRPARPRFRHCRQERTGNSCPHLRCRPCLDVPRGRHRADCFRLQRRLPPFGAPERLAGGPSQMAPLGGRPHRRSRGGYHLLP
jgi:serine/threonine-protein kinase